VLCMGGGGLLMPKGESVERNARRGEKVLRGSRVPSRRTKLAKTQTGIPGGWGRIKTCVVQGGREGAATRSAAAP